MVSRRQFLTGGAALGGAPFINRGRYRLFAQSEAEYSALTLELVRGSTVIDMLGLLTLDWRKLSAWRSEESHFQPADFKKLKDSGITIFHPAVGYTTGDIYRASLTDITGWNIFIAAHANDFLRVDNSADLERVKRLGKVGIIIGQQNSAHFRTVDDVDRFYKIGQRVSQLTYDDNKIGGGCSDPQDRGLSEYGAQIVERMNRLGMAVDVSHCADRTTLDAVDVSSKPVLVTHSDCRALVPASPRCKTDAAIKKVAASGGVLGVSMIRAFVRPQGPATIENVLDHIDYVAKLVGIEHAGIGTDVDLDGRDARLGVKKMDLDGIDYKDKIFDLTEGLVRRNYGRRNIELILGGNFQRALSAIWAV